MDAQGQASNKQEAVAGMTQAFAEANATYLVNYMGCSCAEMSSLRRSLREMGASMQVAKNTLAKKAFSQGGVDSLSGMLSGPTAVVWTGEDVVGPAKLLKEFADKKETFLLKGGYIDGDAVDENGLRALADMPPKEQLLGQLLSLINAPAVKLLRTINAPASSMVRLLSAFEEKLNSEK